MEAATLVVMLSRAADADHDLGAGNDRRDELAAALSALLRDRECRRQQRCARMHAGTWPGQIVHLEGMRERAVGQRRRRCVHAHSVRSENAAVAASAVLLRKLRDDAAPGQAATEDRRGHRVRDALLGADNDVRRDMLVAATRRVVGQFRCLFRHVDRRGLLARVQAKAECAQPTSACASVPNLQRSFRSVLVS